MLLKLSLYYNTLRHLKVKQIVYRLYFSLRSKKVYKYKGSFEIMYPPIHWVNQINGYENYFGNNTFEFLNITKEFDSIDWNYSKNGKLWLYNLNYFNFLFQKGVNKELGLTLITNFIDHYSFVRDGKEPYPTSLRVINWVKFLSESNVRDVVIDEHLYCDMQNVRANLEYHILGNHLLENAFALLFGAYYFGDEKVFKESEELLRGELKEQILKDGGHYERSPMYHQLLFSRVLDSISLVRNNQEKFISTDLNDNLTKIASAMLSWLTQVTFSNHQIPLLNDSTINIAPSTDSLLSYACKLDISSAELALGQSGYRTFNNNLGEVIIDFGDVGPDYQPGHAHSDTFNFVMNYEESSIIVDTGISTYNISERRGEERRTSAHNTTRYGNVEQSEVWGGFRVARRAKCKIIEEKELTILASHTGYQHLNIESSRRIVVEDNLIEIIDEFTGRVKGKCFSYLHFDYKLIPQLKNDKILVGDLEILLIGFENTTLSNYTQAIQYNMTKNAIMFEGEFSEKSSFVIMKKSK